MEEIWKPIKGYEGIYEVSSYGRVRSLDHLSSLGERVKGRVLKSHTAGRGYLSVGLHNGKKKDFYIHRLVASAFIPNPDNLLQVNHKDEDKTNNHADNLEWCDLQYNHAYGTGRARRAEAFPGKKSVIQLDEQGNYIREYTSLEEAARNFSITKNNIRWCCEGKRKHAAGFKWKFKE